MRRHRVRLLRSRNAEGEKPEELSPEESAESVDAGEPDSQEQPELTANLLKRIVGHLKPYLMPTVLVCAVVIVNASIGLMPSIFTGKIVDEAFVGKNMSQLIVLLVTALLATAVNELLYVCIDYGATWIGTHIAHDMRMQLYGHLQRMQQTFFATEKQGTTIIAAHRLSSVLKADRIMVLDGGVISEEGTHEELLEKDGIYRQLFETQFDIAADMWSGQTTNLDIKALSKHFRTKLLSPAEVPDVLDLMAKEGARHVPQDHGARQAKIRELTEGVPEGASPLGRTFVGLYGPDDTIVVAIDFVRGYPDASSGFLRLLLTDGEVLSDEADRNIIPDICAAMKSQGYDRMLVELPDDGEEELAFWESQSFHETGDLADVGRLLVREL